MKVKQAIKKVIALAAGASIVGATLAGAMAADLSNYPAPFVQDGVWSDSVIVVGEKAATSDVVGAIEIAASLQAEAFSLEPVELDTVTDPTVSEGVKIEKSGDKFNYNDDIYDVDNKLTDDDLPDILADGTFEDTSGDHKGDEDYKQYLEFQDGTAAVVYETDEDSEVVGTYINFDKGEDVYVYKIDFDNYVEYDNSTTTTATTDFEGLVLEMQGNTYTITDAKVSSGVLDELNMLAGETVKWLQQDQPLTVGDSTIMVVNVDENGDRCGIEVDGEYKWIDVSSTEEFGDLSIGVLDAIPVHSKDYDQDTCKVSVGSQEIVLKHEDEVNVNSGDVDGSLAQFGFKSGRSDRLDYINVSYDPDDNEWLGPGDEWIDPVFGNWKLVFEGMSAVTEEIKFTGGSSSGKLVFTNTEGDEVEIPFVDDDDTAAGVVHIGDEPLSDFTAANFYSGTTKINKTLLLVDNEYCTGGSNDPSNCEDMLILARGAGGEARVLRLKDIDTTDHEITMEDLTGGGEYTDEYTSGTTLTMDVGFMNIQVNVDEGNGNVTFVEFTTTTYAETKKGGRLSFTAASDGSVRVDLLENEGSDGGVSINFTVSRSFGDDNDGVGFSSVSPSGSECEEDSDDYCAATTYGTTYMYDEENDDDILYTYPEEQAYANVFIAPVSATVSAGEAGSVNREKINVIPVGMAALDKDAQAMNKNMIVVGGPCGNTIAAELAGHPASCAEGYEAGKAKLKLYDRNGKTALLVAGYSAQDTLGASYVIADFNDAKYSADLSGDEVEVVVASLTDISLTAPSPVVEEEPAAEAEE